MITENHQVTYKDSWKKNISIFGHLVKINVIQILKEYVGQSVAVNICVSEETLWTLYTQKKFIN